MSKGYGRYLEETLEYCPILEPMISWEKRANTVPFKGNPELASDGRKKNG